MKHEKLIVAVLFVALLALTVAAVFASRVPPRGKMLYTPYPVKIEKPVPMESVVAP